MSLLVSNNNKLARFRFSPHLDDNIFNFFLVLAYEIKYSLDRGSLNILYPPIGLSQVQLV